MTSSGSKVRIASSGKVPEIVQKPASDVAGYQRRHIIICTCKACILGGTAKAVVYKARRKPGAVTCWYSGLLFRSCSLALAYAAETQVAGRPSLCWLLPFFLPFFFPFLGREALKKPARVC